MDARLISMDESPRRRVSVVYDEPLLACPTKERAGRRRSKPTKPQAQSTKDSRRWLEAILRGLNLPAGAQPHGSAMYDAPLLSCATKDRAGRRRSSTYRKARPSQATPAAPEVAEPRLLSCSEELATAVLLSPDLLLVVFDSLGLGVCLGTLARVCGVWLEAAKARARAWRTLAPSHEIAVPYDDGKRSHPTFAISLPTPAGGLCVADSKNHQLHLMLPASRAAASAARRASGGRRG